MNGTLIYERELGRFAPLNTIVTYDDFDRGFNGWLDLNPNFTEPGFMPRNSIVDKQRWSPIMLSNATFPYAGTHGSMEGTYSLKLSTKAVAGRYETLPVPGSMSHAIKRLSKYRDFERLQIECFYAYTPVQDRFALGEKDIRAFGMLFDIQDKQHRYMPGIRYLNSVNGELKQRWQVFKAADVSDREWGYGTENEWQHTGIDAMWYGRRRPDGTADGYQEVENGRQELVYNESDDKINWLYMRLLVDVKQRRYIEFQSMDKVFDLQGLSPTLTTPYARITNLINPIFFVENDTNRQVSFFVDSVVVSGE